MSTRRNESQSDPVGGASSPFDQGSLGESDESNAEETGSEENGQSGTKGTGSAG